MLGSYETIRDYIISTQKTVVVIRGEGGMMRPHATIGVIFVSNDITRVIPIESKMATEVPFDAKVIFIREEINFETTRVNIANVHACGVCRQARSVRELFTTIVVSTSDRAHMLNGVKRVTFKFDVQVFDEHGMNIPEDAPVPRDGYMILSYTSVCAESTPLGEQMDNFSISVDRNVSPRPHVGIHNHDDMFTNEGSRMHFGPGAAFPFRKPDLAIVPYRFQPSLLGQRDWQRLFGFTESQKRSEYDAVPCSITVDDSHETSNIYEIEFQQEDTSSITECVRQSRSCEPESRPFPAVFRSGI